MPENNNTLAPQISMGEIYEGGSLNPISTDELVNNKVAIRQLVNEVNIKNQQIKKLSDEIATLKGENAGLRNQTLIKWPDAVFNAIGAVILAIGSNIISSNMAIAIALMFLGVVCVVIVNILGFVRTKTQ